MQKIVLAGLLSCLAISNVYAINVPAPANVKQQYDGVTFVNSPDSDTKKSSSTPAPSTTTGTLRNTEKSDDPITTLPGSQTQLASEGSTNSVIQMAANNTKPAPAGCPTTCPQKAPIVVKKEVIQKIVNRQINSANANEIELLLGPACSCITFNPLSADVWTCQWKGDLSSNGLQNTINITFEGGMLAGVTAVRSDGVTYMAMPNANVTVYQPQ
jgi:hypothetical protein